MEEKGNSGKVSLENSGLMPKEEMLETAVRNRRLTIGVAGDNQEHEKRVALTPEAVHQLVEGENEVIIQKGAGLAANYTDKDYSENGAIISDSPAMVYSADAVIKVSPFTEKEAEYLKGNQAILSSLNVFQISEETLRNLIRKKVTAIAFEKIRDQSGEMPYIESMSEISGITSLLIASEYLSNLHGGKGVLLGGIAGITPTEVVIIGANTAGESASRAALGLGATVKIFDNSIPKLRMIQNALGQRLQTSVFHPQVLKKALKSADVLIGAMELDDMQPIYHVTEEMVRSMKKGAIVIDLSNTGGCIETTECRFMRGPVYEKAGITHFSAWNLPSRVARTASIAASNIFTPLLQRMADAGGLNQLLKYDQGVRKGAYLYNGLLTNATLGLKFGIISKDLDLLITAF
ncbi:MAG TPA: alanine dehydrogenase [Bacteroidales bacterium]|nr:alanine dehydrogenase [Bacteroidales bacterium]